MNLEVGMDSSVYSGVDLGVDPEDRRQRHDARTEARMWGHGAIAEAGRRGYSAISRAMRKLGACWKEEHGA